MELLSTEHVAAVVATAVLAALAVGTTRTVPEDWTTVCSRVLALLILAAYATDHAVAIARGDWSLERYLPFHLTDAVTIVVVVALWAPRPLPVELAYFWGLTASMQAVLTPNLGVSFPDVQFWTYFTTHSGAVAAACLLVFGRCLRPRPGALRRVFIATLAAAAGAAIANVVTGGNYMYLRAKPSSWSLLDLLGPWPWYIASAAALAFLMFAALDAPFARRRA